MTYICFVHFEHQKMVGRRASQEIVSVRYSPMARQRLTISWKYHRKIYNCLTCHLKYVGHVRLVNRPNKNCGRDIARDWSERRKLIICVLPNASRLCSSDMFMWTRDDNTAESVDAHIYVICTSFAEQLRSIRCHLFRLTVAYMFIHPCM